MTYKLAKELKEAGFPQIEFRECKECAVKPGSPVLCQNCLDRRFNHVTVPTLSELIEACGKPLSLDTGEFDGDTWFAWRPQTSNIFGSGTTPEEAVAKLWLALNKKV